MLGFLKNSHKKIWPVEVDMHSHLLPGVDDGAPEVDTSISLIRSLQSMGYKKLITTPHIYADLYPNSLITLQPAYDSLIADMAKAGIDMPIRFAAEYFLDDHLDGLVMQQQQLLTLKDNWVLVETSFVQPLLDLDRRLFDLQVAGYVIVLAHPERYAYWHGEVDRFHRFRESGILLQVNLLSLTGYYGRGVAETARYLFRENLVDMVGTDCHHERHIMALKKWAGEITRITDPLFRKGRLLNNQIF